MMASVNDFRVALDVLQTCQLAEVDSPYYVKIRASARTPDAGRRIASENTSGRGAGYDVSPADAPNESLGGMRTKGDDPWRGKTAPRVRRTLPHCGQRADSAGLILR